MAGVKRWLSIRAALVVAVVALGACAGGPAPDPPARPNVLVVLVDTLRADRLSLYGYERETSPALERFARERGVVFRSAWSNAGCTYPSVNSLLTGRFPQRILARIDEAGMAIPAGMPTLAERFGAAGWSTGAISASTIVRATPSKINRQGGFDRGFGFFDESCHERGAACVNGRAFESLDRLPEPFFLYLHYLDPHSPYRPPSWAARRFSSGSAADARRWAQRGEPWKIQRKLYHGESGNEFGAADIRHLSDLYDDEIRFFDDQFDQLIAELARRGLLERTVVAFVADHGEELYENGGWAHCGDLAWESVLATPFVLAGPGLEPGARATPVSNVDLAPTLLALAGIEHASSDFDGASLVPLLEQGDGALGGRVVFAAQGRIRVARDGGARRTLDLASGESWQQALAGDGAAGGRDLATALTGWVRAVEGDADAAAVERADRLEAELAALGYL
jgi:arylsulfatase A-like enzyme